MDLLKLHSVTNKLIDRVDHIEKVAQQKTQQVEVLLKTPLGAVFRFTRSLTRKQCSEFLLHVELYLPELFFGSLDPFS